MKLCINCKYHRPGDMCGHPKAISPVDGRPFYSCKTEREVSLHGGKYTCGYVGKWFEPKPMGDSAAALQDYAVHSIMQAAERVHKREHKPVSDTTVSLHLSNSYDDLYIPGPCSHCGDPNHWRPDCPKLFPVKATRLPWWKRIFRK